MSQAKAWSKLDNAAKIFPPTSSRLDTKVFRFSCELFEDVEPAVLQTALARATEKFPFYKSLLKRGLFWYYLERTVIEPKVANEPDFPCRPLYWGEKKRLLFEVSFYRKRINLEIYHALSDGDGALQFLRTLVSYYLAEKYPQDAEALAISDYDASAVQKEADSFSKYYSGENSPSKILKPLAYKVRGERFPGYRLCVIEGTVSVKALLALTRAAGATISEYLTAVLIHAIHEGMTLREETKPIVISIPVNLRNYFPAVSARNFFSVITVSHNFSSDGKSFEDILTNIRAKFKEQLTQEKLLARLNNLSGWEHNLAAKLIPLFIKDIFLKVINQVADREITAALSNVGRITMPEAAAKYIRLFDLFTSTKRIQPCLCSYGDILQISFSSSFISSDIQRCFFRLLSSKGIDVELSSNITEVG